MSIRCQWPVCGCRDEVCDDNARDIASGQHKNLGEYMYVGRPAASKSGKTKIWYIYDRRGGMLGNVRWFGRWRCYAFNPDPGTVFNASCMEELARFCKNTTKEHRESK